MTPVGTSSLRTYPAFTTFVRSVGSAKVSTRIDGWLREAYFGQLLEGHQRAIQVFDTFPLMRADGQVLYCLALEYARHGDLGAFLARTGKGWSEATARREIAGILAVLGKRRSEAVRAARRAGAVIHGIPSVKTRVVVRGRPNPLQAAGRDAGLKLMEIKRLREKGHRITLLNETQFWRLVDKR